MKNKNELDFLDLTSKMRIFESDFKKISELEKLNDMDNLSKALIQLDKKQSGVTLSDIAGIDKKVMNYEAIKVKDVALINLQEATMQPITSAISGLINIKEISCDCVIPFCFDQMRVYGDISGPAMSNVTRGIIGANRYSENEYRVYNGGDTNGKGRVHKIGSLDILFSAIIPNNGRYCLLLPVGNLLIGGYSRVLGHGNMTTCYDSKIWVDYFSILHIAGTILEVSHADIHYDGTRSEDRTKGFGKNISLEPHYLFFNADAGQKIELILRIQVDTAANEDGKTWGIVNIFGLPANTKTDYDTMIIKS